MPELSQYQMESHLTSGAQEDLMEALTRRLRTGSSATGGYWDWSDPTYSEEQGLTWASPQWKGRKEELAWLETDPSQIVNRWQATIANPMMKAWERTAGPMSKRKYNLPGSFYSADASRGMMGDAEAFMATNLMPSLYSSVENMYSRLSTLLASSTTAQTMGTDIMEKQSWSDEIGAGIGAFFGMGG